MRLIVFDPPQTLRQNFYPLSLSRPLWELRCGMTTLGQKLARRFSTRDVTGFTADYLAPVWRKRSDWAVNALESLAGDDLLLIDARVKADACDGLAAGPSRTHYDSQGNVAAVRILNADRPPASAGLESLLDWARAAIPAAAERLATWNYAWDLVLANPQEIVRDFAAAGRSGVEGTIEEPRAVRGSLRDVYVAPGAVVHPMVVIDAEHGPVYLDEGAVVHPFSRIEGPCYVGPKSVLLGAKCREGNSIGPVCRVGGEIEESIIQGYSNKYHDGFLGHAYLGEWVNLGALTTNSDLKNDYSSVSVVLDGQRAIDTGSTKVGSLIGDHTKTSIGTLLNTGACVGAMCMLLTNGRLLPKFIPSFCWHYNGALTQGKGKAAAYETARAAMARRKVEWSAEDEALWDAAFDLTAVTRERLWQGTTG